MRVNIDWDGQNYSSLNGFHPLFRFLLFNPEEHSSPQVDYVVQPYSEKVASYHTYETIFETLGTDIRNRNRFNEAFRWTWGFFDFEEQLLTEINCLDAYFCHTFPLSVGIAPFIFHVEDIKSLFLPFASYFNIDINIVNQHARFNEYRHYIGKTLGTSKCIGIVCHYRATSEALVSLFADYKLERKIFNLSLPTINRTNNITQPVQASHHRSKDRILFTGSYHGNANSIGQRGLESFTRVCTTLADTLNDLRLKPTLLLPYEIDSKFLNDTDFDIIYGFMSDNIYKHLLGEASFHFLPSPWVHTKTILDCIHNDITPICRLHSAYQELGLNEGNTICLGKKLDYNPLSFYSHEAVEISIDLTKLGYELKQFMERPIKSSGVIIHSSPSLKNNALNELNKFILKSFERYSLLTVQRSIPKGKPLLNIPLSIENFEVSPILNTHAKFNGIEIKTNRDYWLISRIGAPSPRSIRELLNSNSYYKSPDGRVLLDNLDMVYHTMSWNSGLSGIASIKVRAIILLRNRPFCYNIVKSFAKSAAWVIRWLRSFD